MLGDEDYDEADGESRILEIVPLPPHFPDDRHEAQIQGAYGVFGMATRPTRERAVEPAKMMVEMIVRDVLVMGYDLEWLYREREIVLPLLLEAHDKFVEAHPTAQADIARIRRYLWVLQAPGAMQWMADSLAATHPARKENLHELRVFCPMHGLYAYPVFCEEPFRSELIHCLNDEETRDDALVVASSVKLPELSDILFQMAIGTGEFPSSYSVADATWDAAQQKEVIEAIQRRLESADQKQTRQMLQALERKWISPTGEAPAELQQLALQIAEEFFLNPARSFHQEAARVLATKGSAACLPEAEKLVFEDKYPDAIPLYFRLAKDRLRPDFNELMNDPQLDHVVLRVLSVSPTERLDPAWAPALVPMLKKGVDAENRALKVLGRMGSAGLAEARKHYPRLPMHLFWIERGFTLQAAVNDLIRLGLVDSSLRIDPNLDPTDSESLKSVMADAGILYAFDSEHDFIPPPNHDLVMQCAEHSRGRFRPLHARQYFFGTKDNEPPRGMVEFVHSGKLVRFSTDDMGDYYDVVSVLQAANLALSTVGEPGRFLCWPEMDQMVTVIFGPPDKFQEFSRLYAMPLDTAFADSRDAPNWPDASAYPRFEMPAPPAGSQKEPEPEMGLVEALLRLGLFAIAALLIIGAVGFVLYLKYSHMFR